MKTIVMTLLVATLGVAWVATAAQNNVILNYRVSAASVYADGTPVMDGERYALVYLPDGADAAACPLAADGNVTDSSAARLLKTKRVYRTAGERWCYFNFQLTPDEAAACADGSLQVYLLDTRVIGEDGASALAETKADGSPSVVNAATAAAGAEAVDAMVRNRSVVNAAALKLSAADATALPSGAETPEKPVIKGMRLEKGKLILTVGKTVPYLAYNVTKSGSAGVAPGDAQTHAAASPKQGVAGGTIELEVPLSATDGAAFFRIDRH